MERWWERAACRGMPIELFFPGRGDTSIREALAVCADCPVREECLDDALSHSREGTYGIWGGMSERQREYARRDRRRAALAGGEAPNVLDLREA